MRFQRDGHVWTLVCVALATATGLWLRVRGLADVSLWLDEILNVGILVDGERRWYAWLIGFERENGPLYYALHAAGMGIVEDVELAWRLPEVAAGVLAIPLIALAALRLSGSRLAAAAAAVVLAASPFHVYYSREGRPYALMMLGAVAALACVTCRSERRRSVLLTLVACFLAAVAATAVPLIAAIALVSVVASRRGWKNRAFSGLPVIALPLAALFYGRFTPGGRGSGFEHSAASLSSEVVMTFGVWSREGLTRADLAFVIVAAIGALLLVRKRAVEGLGTLVMTIVPAVGAVVALITMDHWFSVRYVAASFPALVVLVACGLALMPWPSWGRVIMVIVAASGWVALTLPPAMTRPLDRTDWQGLAEWVWERSQPGDSLVATSAWSAHSLRFYLDRLPDRVRLMDVSGNEDLARWVRGRRERAWVVHGGFEMGGAIRGWACEFPVLFTDPVEEVSLHYFPSIADFLLQRATPGDAERFRAAWIEGAEGSLSSGSGADAILGEGWHGAERDAGIGYRWSRRMASFVVPPGTGERLTLEMNPYAAERGGPERVIVRSGADVLGISGLEDRSVELSLPVLRAPSRVDLEFDREQVPAEGGDGADIRALAATLSAIRIGEGRTGPGEIRIRAGRGATPPPAGTLCEGDVDRERRLLLRAEISASDLEAWTRRGRSGWELVALRAARSPCQSDREWIDAAYGLILGAVPDEAGASHHQRAMQRGATRAQIARRIAAEHLRCAQ